MAGANDPTTAGEPTAEALSAQADERLTAKRYAEAAALYERALALDDQRVKDWINRAGAVASAAA